jgi:predicted DNA-binding protein (MmcQ/YjbR family)
MHPKGTLRICPLGHRYYKSSDCPTCPKCESEKQPASAFLQTLAAPARRALENAGISNLKKLARYTEDEVLALHGFGKSSLPKLRDALKKASLSFKESRPRATTSKNIEWLRQHCLSLPGTVEQPHFEKTSFRVNKKIYVTIDQKNNRACLKLTPAQQDIYVLAHKKTIMPVPNKWGKQGWTFADLANTPKKLLAAMVKEAHRDVLRIT